MDKTHQNNVNEKKYDKLDHQKGMGLIVVILVLAFMRASDMGKESRATRAEPARALVPGTQEPQGEDRLAEVAPDPERDRAPEKAPSPSPDPSHPSPTLRPLNLRLRRAF